MKNLITRAGVGALYVGLVYVCTTDQPFLLILLITIFTGFCVYEFIKLVDLKDIIYLIGCILVAGYILYFFANDFFNGDSPYALSAIQYAPPALFFLSCITIFFSSSELESDFAKATLVVTYITTPFAIAFSFPQIIYDIGEKVITKEVFFIFLLIWCSDTFAYVVGSLIGKHKLAPNISKNKSWEGLIGGIVFSVIAGFLIQKYFGMNLKGNWMIIGILVSIAAPMGDLVESKLKRIFHVKDSGHLIPGHGGFLDRLDSFIFTSVIIYTYFLIETNF